MSSVSKEREIARLRDWCLVVLEALAEFSPIHRATKEEWTRSLDGAVHRGELTGLREGARDLLVLVQGLSPSKRARIEDALRSQLGMDLTKEIQSTDDQVKAVIERGAIENDEEVLLLESWLDVVRRDAKKSDDVALIEKLLEEYIPGR